MEYWESLLCDGHLYCDREQKALQNHNRQKKYAQIFYVRILLMGGDAVGGGGGTALVHFFA